ncbi:NAD(+) diphosphatase [Demetria terragena]|uniref:NAD(+) diphosphatase n=1 Tax=Demetria terragena TaxID=63959 RepID=UPI000476751E|nr:NAD(+) diphosphatase [Demetria terragena]
MPDSVPRPFALSRATVDRSGLQRRDPALLPRALADERTGVLDLFGDRAPYVGGPGEPRLRLRSPTTADRDATALWLGQEGDRAMVAIVHPPQDDGDDQRANLRRLGVALDDRDAGLFTTALGLANWHAAQGFCPICGHPTVIRDAGWTRVCSGCSKVQFPRTDAAVIMAVVDPDERLLLARGPQWGPGRLSVLAGFVEPGESLEAAVAREVMEEVGVPVSDVRYAGNQPWPFPASLMLGFSALATDTSLRLDPAEIAEARWVSRDELTREIASGDLAIASRISIARHLIEGWYGGEIDAP